MLYIKRVELKNIRCFEEFVLEFDEEQNSVLLVGDNGEGKSTLLRSIAISICDFTSAAGLFRELKGKFIRKRSKQENYIEIHLEDKIKKNITYIIRTDFVRLKGTDIEQLNQTLQIKHGNKSPIILDQEMFPWNRLFVVGYGAGSRVLGSGSIDSYSIIDAVYTLFRYDEPLQNPELALRRLKDEVEKKKIRNPSDIKFDTFESFLILLRDLLNLNEKGEVILTKKGIEVRGPWGRGQLESLGDGYKSTLIWVLDMIGRKIIYGKTLDPKMITGIVLLDEVEQHLHPKWQINVMPLLTEAFPRIQFITTTHSPLVVSGCKKCKIRKVSKNRDEIDSAYGWRAEDVYRNILDIRTSRHPDVQELIDSYRELDLKRLTTILSGNEKKELKSIKQMLNQTLHGSDPMLLSIELKNLKQVLNKKDVK